MTAISENVINILDDPINIKKLIKDTIGLEKPEDPFYICNIGDIVRKYFIWREKLPRVVPHYAVKCNDDEIVLKVLSQLGCGFDCASKGEINKILNLGVSSDHIIFANPAKPKSHILYALNTGVKVMTFDSLCELEKIKLFYPDAQLVLRIRCDAEKAQCPLGEKFGCDPIYEAPKLLQQARHLKLNIVGISFHVGSGCRDPPVFNRAISTAKGLFDFAAKIGYNLSILDIGGGFPGDKGTTIDEIANVVNNALNEYFPDDSVHIISEPGRFFVASAFTLACMIHSKREVSGPDKPEKHIMYFINDGVYGSFNCKLYDHKVVLPKVLKKFKGKKYKSTIWGPSCDALDQVCDSIMLPQLSEGDWFLFENMGAYTVPIASAFNGFPIPKIKYYVDADTWYINILKKTYMKIYDKQFRN